MNEIDKLLKNLKQDQNTLLENFREEVLRIQSGQQTIDVSNVEKEGFVITASAGSFAFV